MTLCSVLFHGVVVQVRHFESVVKELSQPAKQQADGGQVPPSSEAMKRLVAVS